MPDITADEAAIQAMIAAKQLPGVRLTPEYIGHLHASLSVQTVRVGHSTTVLAAAYLPDGTLVATAHSKPADPAAFDLETGIESASRAVRAAAREKLWELEGYRLSRAVAVLSGPPVDAVAKVVHEDYVRRLRDEGITSRPAPSGEE